VGSLSDRIKKQKNANDLKQADAIKTFFVGMIILLIVLSLVVNITFNNTENSLYGAEFTAPIKMINEGTFATVQFIEWIMLLIAHAGIFCLPFLTMKRYFRSLLVWVPLFFITIYTLYASIFILVLLIPFIFIWIITLIFASQMKQATKRSDDCWHQLWF
jgi:hypothetical protein